VAKAGEAGRRANGAGNIRKIGNCWYWRTKVDGKQIQRRLDAKTEAQAQAEAQRFAALASAKSEEEVVMVAAKARGVIKHAEAVALDRVFEIFEKSPKRPECGAGSLARHERAWKKFMEYLRGIRPGVTSVADVTAADAEAFAGTIMEMHSASYNVYIGSLKLIFRILGPPQGNPFREVGKKSNAGVSKKEFDASQLAAVFAAVDRDYPLSMPHRDEMKVLFRLGAYTGMRLVDCAMLKWADVNLDRGTINARPAKTAKSGTQVIIPLHGDLRSMLEALPPGKDYVLPGVAVRYQANPSGVDKTACMAIWYALTEVKSATERPKSIKGFGFHSFRHSFVSFCANAGVPLSVVQAIVGHGNPAMTRHYSHIGDDAMRKAVNSLPGTGQRMGDGEKLAKLRAMVAGDGRLVRKALLELLDA